MLENKKNLILNVAVSVFSDKGVNNTSMEFVAEAAKVSTRTLYKHFPNKNVLFDAVLQGVFQTLKKEVEIKYHAEKNILSMLDDMIDLQIQLCLDKTYQQAIQLVYYEVISGNIDQSVINSIGLTEKSFLIWLGHCRQAGRLSERYDIHKMNEIYHQFFKSLFILPVLFKQHGLLDEGTLGQRKLMLNSFFIDSFVVNDGLPIANNTDKAL